MKKTLMFKVATTINIGVMSPQTFHKGQQMNDIMKTQQIKPYYIEELGCEGLSVSNIASSLKTDRKHILQRMRRPAFKALIDCNEYRMITRKNVFPSIEGKLVKQGRPEQVCFLETRAAKALVATYASKEGFRYLDFLFNCEQVVLEQLPQLRAKLQILESRNQYLESVMNHKQQTLSGPRKGSLSVPVYNEDMFGQVFVQKWELAHRDSMSEIDKVKAKLRHAIKVNQGLTKGIEELNERMLCLEEGKQRRILKAVKDE